MKRTLLAALATFAFWPLMAESPASPAPSVPEIREVSMPQGAQTGDQEIQFALSMTWPFSVLNPYTNAFSTSNTYPGGMFSIEYAHYLADGFFIGGTLGASFNSSITSRLLFTVPISFNAGFTFADTFIQVPLILRLGYAPRTLGEWFHADPFLQAAAGFYYRIAPAWSLGGEAALMAMPDFYVDSGQNRVGFIFDVKIAIKHHL